VKGAIRVRSLPALSGRDVPAQGEFLVVYATVANDGSEPLVLSSRDFAVVASGNVNYGLASQSGLKEEGAYRNVWVDLKLDPEWVEPIRLVFDLPRDARGLRLRIQGITFAIPDPD